jgi:hypothetical protein
VFGRSPRADPEAPESVPQKEGGKGRPTPRRREAERGRRRAVSAPASRKEAYKKARERQRAERTQAVKALRSGDERHLPPRDRGPVRRYARDMVDARRSIAEFFLPLALLILVLTLVNNDQARLVGNFMWLVVVVLILVDSVVLVTRLRRGLRRSLPDERHRGATAYALMRSTQIRRFRLPPPRVRPGGRPRR